MLLANQTTFVGGELIQQLRTEEKKKKICAANDLIVLNILQCAFRNTLTVARLTQEATQQPNMPPTKIKLVCEVCAAHVAISPVCD